MRREEDVAGRLVGDAMGVPWVGHDDGSRPGMYDIRFESEPPTALEVVTLTNSAKREDFSAFRWLRGLHGGQELQRHWTLIVQAGTAPSVRFKDVPGRVVRALAVLEDGQVYSIEGGWATGHWRCPHASAAVEVATCIRGGRASSREISPAFPPGVEFVLATSSSWPPDPDSVSDWIEKQLHRPELSDVVRKLRQSGLKERHVFLWIDQMHGPWAMFRHWGTSKTPDTPLRLPQVVTRVWIGGYGSMLWSYCDTEGWQAFDVGLDQPAGPWVDVI